jgi:hypothetical protein
VLNIGYYHEKYGDVPQDKLLEMVRAETLDEETKRLLLHGMQNLVSALGEAMGLTDGGDDEPRHEAHCVAGNFRLRPERDISPSPPKS